jgi:hypothetical protein
MEDDGAGVGAPAPSVRRPQWALLTWIVTVALAVFAGRLATTGHRAAGGAAVAFVDATIATAHARGI